MRRIGRKKKLGKNGGISMKFSKRMIMIGLALMIVVGIFVGYGKAQALTPKKEITLALWDYDLLGYDKKIVEAFSKRYPNIKVRVISTPNAEHEKKIAIMLAGGAQIDVFYPKSGKQYASFVGMNYVRRLDDLIKKDKIALKPYDESIIERCKINGKMYTLPYRKNYYLLYYNKEIFDKAKLPYPTNDMTWEKYREIGKKLTSGEGINKTYGIFQIPRMNYYDPIWCQKDEIDLVTGDLRKMKHGMQFMLDIQDIDKSCVDYITNKSMNADQVTFEKGRSAMLWNGSWFIQMLMQDKKYKKYNFEWGVVKSPYWKGSKQKCYSTFTPVCINVKTTKLRESWQLLKFITGKKGAKILAREGILPAYLDNSILSIFDHTPGIPKGTAAAIKGNKIFVRKTDVKQTTMQKIIDEEGELVFTHNKSIGQAITDMEKRRKELLKQ
jgi:multiple sugar transport system substrate-binding protein